MCLVPFNKPTDYIPKNPSWSFIFLVANSISSFLDIPKWWCPSLPQGLHCSLLSLRALQHHSRNYPHHTHETQPQEEEFGLCVLRSCPEQRRCPWHGGVREDRPLKRIQGSHGHRKPWLQVWFLKSAPFHGIGMCYSHEIAWSGEMGGRKKTRRQEYQLENGHGDLGFRTWISRNALPCDYIVLLLSTTWY